MGLEVITERRKDEERKAYTIYIERPDIAHENTKKDAPEDYI